MASGPIRVPDFGVPANDGTYTTQSTVAASEARAPSSGGGGPPPAPPSDGSARKFRARRVNEHVKAAYALTNTLGAAILGAAYILPEINRVGGPQALDRPSWVVIGVILCAFGHLLIWKFLRSED